ncbi:MAG: helix-turn-helix domain-containing protein [Peptostreptococcus porci]|uniref:helix-turn-helix domain-containing protein n=1 Tax=Peptostreptococcus porci TaxID=2652282 RepID=UPI002A9098A0|nr:helix-turn-helix domain-containing protein [Peptostreptococcus porci]MDY5478849.1 helix-turn-helix domain-containing protein [Peptostreptococcus porci]
MVGFYDKISPKNSDIESEYYSFSFASYRANSFILNENCYRVVLVLDGNISIIYMDEKISLNKGQLYIINPCKVYRVLSNCNQENLILYFDINLEFALNACSVKTIASFDFDSVHEDNIEYQEIISTMNELLCLYIFEENVSEGVYVKLVRNMLKKLFENFSSKDSNDEKEKIDIWFSKKLVEYTKMMFEEPQNGYSLMQLSSDFNNYSSYVSKIYKKVLGVKFVECHIFARIEKSMEWLIDSDKSILEIATECGFMSSKSFYENYKKYMDETPSQFRKKMRCSRQLDYKYTNMPSILESDVVYEIFEEREDANRNVSNDSDEGIHYDIDVNRSGFSVEACNKRVVNLNIFGDRWMETIETIQRSLRYDYVTISLLFNRNVYFVYDEFSKERIDFTKFMHYIHKLENLNLKPVIVLEFMHISDKSDLINMREASYKTLERFLNSISEVISVSKLKYWKFELKMPWVWMDYKDDEEYYYNKNLYNKIRKLIRNKLQNKKIGIHMGNLNLIKSNKQYERVKSIVDDDFDIDSLSFSVVDPYIYSDKSNNKCVLIRRKEHIDKIINFVNSLKERNRYKVYISDMYLYYEWEKLSRYYWESMFALCAVDSYIEMQENKLGISSVKYYNNMFSSRERFEKKKKEYIGKYELSNEFGIYNACFYVEKILSEINGECIYSEPGVFFVKDDDEYLCLLYQDIHRNIKKVSDKVVMNYNSSHEKYKIRISGLHGRYKISTKSTHSENGTFYREWKNMGAPNQLSREEKEYISSKITPNLYVEFVDIHDTYDTEIKLGLFEIKFIKITKIGNFV